MQSAEKETEGLSRAVEEIQITQESEVSQSTMNTQQEVDHQSKGTIES